MTWVGVLFDRLNSFRFRCLGVHLGQKIRVGPRCRITNPSGVKIGGRAWLEADVWFKLSSPDATVCVGEYTFFARNCTLNAMESIAIGSHTLFGPGCVVVDHNHGIGSDSRMDEQPCRSKPIKIGSDVWCGAGVVILAGVTIGDGAVIGANAVVTKDIPSMAIAAGSPARTLHMRNEDQVVG